MEVSFIRPLFENFLPVLHAFLRVFIFNRLLILPYIPRQLSRNVTPLLQRIFLQILINASVAEFEEGLKRALCPTKSVDDEFRPEIQQRQPPQLNEFKIAHNSGREKLKQLKVKKSTGPDNIAPILLKAAKMLLCYL